MCVGEELRYNRRFGDDVAVIIDCRDEAALFLFL